MPREGDPPTPDRIRHWQDQCEQLQQLLTRCPEDPDAWWWQARLEIIRHLLQRYGHTRPEQPNRGDPAQTHAAPVSPTEPNCLPPPVPRPASPPTTRTQARSEAQSADMAHRLGRIARANLERYRLNNIQIEFYHWLCLSPVQRRKHLDQIITQRLKEEQAGWVIDEDDILSILGNPREQDLYGQRPSLKLNNR